MKLTDTEIEADSNATTARKFISQNTNGNTQKDIGYISVDSGRITIQDPCYIIDDDDKSISHGELEFHIHNISGEPERALYISVWDGVFKLIEERDAEGELVRIILEL